MRVRGVQQREGAKATPRAGRLVAIVMLQLASLVTVGAAHQGVAMAKETNLVYVDKVMARDCATARAGFGYPPSNNAGRSGCTGSSAGTIGTEAELGPIAATRSHLPGYSFGDQVVGVTVLGWNSWLLPDNARVIRAYADVRIGSVESTDGRSLVGEWYEPTGSGISNADYAADAPAAPNAVDPVPLSSITPGGLLRLELKDAAEHIEVFGTGSTDIRFHITGGQPTGRNRVVFDTSHQLDSDDYDVHIEYVLAVRPCDVSPIDAGGQHTVAARADGTPLTWGSNEHGQLAHARPSSRIVADRALPAQVVDVAAGESHTLLVLDDGTVWAAGKNESGQLGNGVAAAAVGVPVRVPGIDGVVAVAAGTRHSLALKTDGTVWAWGSNAGGQLGTGTGVDAPSPTKIDGLTSVVAIAAGAYHSLALTSSGAVYSWGLNELGQLGDGSTTSRLAPVGPIVTGVARIAAGDAHALAAKTNGGVVAWGDNSSGQLGDGTFTQRTSPQPVGAIVGAVRVAAGAEHSLALLGDGQVLAWGANTVGQLGLGVGGAPRRTPTAVAGATRARFIAAGAHHSLAVDSAGAILAWGWNDSGQLGDGSTTTRLAPVAVTDVDGLARPC